MTNNLISIITPTYNCGAYIGETIESVQQQTVHNWEMIIVDDCSTDDTQQIVAAYAEKDDRIKYHKLAQNAGAAVARTVAMELAQGEYMAFLDSDDLWMPEKLARQLQFMQQNKYHFTCTAYEQMDQQGHSTGKVIHTKPKTDYNGVLLTCPVGNSTVMYNVGAMGKFKVPNIRKRNDDALWLQMLKKERYIYGMPDVLMRYRIREGSISVKKTALIKYHWKLYREIEHLSVFRSVFHIGCWVFIKVFHIK